MQNLAAGLAGVACVGHLTTSETHRDKSVQSKPGRSMYYQKAQCVAAEWEDAHLPSKCRRRNQPNGSQVAKALLLYKVDPGFESLADLLQGVPQKLIKGLSESGCRESTRQRSHGNSNSKAPVCSHECLGFRLVLVLLRIPLFVKPKDSTVQDPPPKKAPMSQFSQGCPPSDAQWPWEKKGKRAPIFCWLSEKGNPYPKKGKGHHWATEHHSWVESLGRKHLKILGTSIFHGPLVS